jgi:hypothetical protein
MKKTLTALAGASAAALAAGQTAPQPPTAASSADQRIVIEGHYDNAVGSTDAASSGSIRASLLKSRPPLRPGEVLEFVPGLIVTQHSGDGKANQYFLRGFNLDHGTDFATRVAGMPVNVPSHGHGQGYTDLNFLIPELVQRIDYRKGPYHATHGDFASAGAADIHYRHRFDAAFGQLTLGEDRHRRLVAGGSTPVGGDLHLLGAVELLRNDGPWTVPEDLVKNNGLLTLSGGRGPVSYALTAMAYRATWTATDQIPERLIRAGSYNGAPFGRFDSLDTSTGGSTHRASLSGQWQHEGAAGRTRLSAYVIRYALDLNSNFTYALDRPADGDQFKQRDRRQTYGIDASQTISHRFGTLPARSEAGLQMRHDRARVGLFDSVARAITTTVREDDVRLTGLGLYAQSAVELNSRLRIVAGLRADHLRTQVDALTLAANGGKASDTQWSPKLALIAGPFDSLPKTEFFFNAGRGFHSNDARGTTATIDPKSGDPVDRVPPLVAQRGIEIGARTEAIAGLQSSIALWQLRSDSELVYIGDAGATEASGASRRRGVEWSNRWVPLPWLLLDADVAWSHGRFSNGDRIPNAVDRVASLAATVREFGPWSASLQWRHLGPGALVEDNSVRSRSSLTSNLRLGYRFSPKVEWTLDIFNLMNRRMNDIQYFYESQLPGEAQAVADRHVHPAEPRSARLTLNVKL